MRQDELAVDEGLKGISLVKVDRNEGYKGVSKDFEGIQAHINTASIFLDRRKH